MANLGTVEIKVTELEAFKILAEALENIRKQDHGNYVHALNKEGEFFNGDCPCCIAERALLRATKSITSITDREVIPCICGPNEACTERCDRPVPNREGVLRGENETISHS